MTHRWYLSTIHILLNSLEGQKKASELIVELKMYTFLPFSTSFVTYRVQIQLLKKSVLCMVNLFQINVSKLGGVFCVKAVQIGG